MFRFCRPRGLYLRGNHSTLPRQHESSHAHYGNDKRGCVPIKLYLQIQAVCLRVCSLLTTSLGFLEQWFLNFGVHQNHLSTGPIPSISDSGGLE